MKSSLELDITATARRDIRAILRHSRRVWGEEQRREYAERLDSAMLQLTEFPLLGSVRNEILEGLRAFVVGQHLILHQVDDQTVRVIRVLHKRMDVAGKLGG